MRLSSVSHIGIRGLALALSLSFVLAPPAAAATWDPWIPVAVHDEFTGEGDLGMPGGLAVLPPTSAVALYASYGGIFVRRTIDAGDSWLDPIQLSDKTAIYERELRQSFGIAARDSNVDVVWIEDPDVSTNTHIRYARSTNGGATFAPSVPIVPPVQGRPLDVSVARGPANTTAIAWTKRYRGHFTVRVKISTDGGTTFGPTIVLHRSGFARSAKVAVGDGVIYVAHVSRAADGTERLRVRRSLDMGVSWSAPDDLSRVLSDRFRGPFPGQPSIIAAGSRAYVGFSAPASDGTGRAAYRGTADRGNTWSARVKLATVESGSVVLSLGGGVLRVAYTRCREFDSDEFGSYCVWYGVKYREKVLGQSLSSAETLASVCCGPWAAGIGFAGKPLVLWNFPPDGSCCDVPEFGTYLATRQP